MIIDIVMAHDDPACPDLRFVEVEDSATGCSVEVGEWIRRPDGLLALRMGIPDPPPARACLYCGCTDALACPQGCAWVADDVCSTCLNLAGEEVSADVANAHGMRWDEQDKRWRRAIFFDGVRSLRTANTAGPDFVDPFRAGIELLVHDNAKRVARAREAHLVDAIRRGDRHIDFPAIARVDGTPRIIERHLLPRSLWGRWRALRKAGYRWRG